MTKREWKEYEYLEANYQPCPLCKKQWQFKSALLVDTKKCCCDFSERLNEIKKQNGIKQFKECATCLKLLPDNQFYRSPRYRCKPCHLAYVRAWQSRNTDRVNAANRRYRARQRDFRAAIEIWHDTPPVTPTHMRNGRLHAKECEKRGVV